jgi:REP element-mobilizing transposase RayT
MSGSRRLYEYNYADPGSYFVTICVQNMEHRFGEIIDGTNHLNDAGRLITEIWESNMVRYQNVEPDAFVVMPNHLHGIIHIGTNPDSTDTRPSLTNVVGTFKSLSTSAFASRVRSGSFPPFDKSLWQRSFYDRIIRDQGDLEAIREYIAANPARWWTRRGGENT